MTRSEHLQWCKDRAMEYVRMRDNDQAFASFLSDMRKHPETADHIALALMGQMYFAGQLNSSGAMADFIEGFN